MHTFVYLFNFETHKTYLLLVWFPHVLYVNSHTFIIYEIHNRQFAFDTILFNIKPTSIILQWRNVVASYYL